jgi:hypothetical protein
MQGKVQALKTDFIYPMGFIILFGNLLCCSMLNREGPSVSCQELLLGAVNDCKDGIIASCEDQNIVTYEVCTESVEGADASSLCEASWQKKGAYACKKNRDWDSSLGGNSQGGNGGSNVGGKSQGGFGNSAGQPGAGASGGPTRITPGLATPSGSNAVLQRLAVDNQSIYVTAYEKMTGNRESFVIRLSRNGSSPMVIATYSKDAEPLKNNNASFYYITMDDNSIFTGGPGGGAGKIWKLGKQGGKATEVTAPYLFGLTSDPDSLYFFKNNNGFISRISKSGGTAVDIANTGFSGGELVFGSESIFTRYPQGIFQFNVNSTQKSLLYSIEPSELSVGPCFAYSPRGLFLVLNQNNQCDLLELSLSSGKSHSVLSDPNLCLCNSLAVDTTTAFWTTEQAIWSFLLE